MEVGFEGTTAENDGFKAYVRDNGQENLGEPIAPANYTFFDAEGRAWAVFQAFEKGQLMCYRIDVDGNYTQAKRIPFE